MKRILSLILAASILFAIPSPALAEETNNYEYIIPMEHQQITRLGNCYLVVDDKQALYGLDGTKLSADFESIGSFNDNGVAVAEANGKHYIINTSGEILSEFDRKIISVGDYVLVNMSERNEQDGRPFSYYEGEFGVYTYTGELLRTLSYDKFKPSKLAGFFIEFVGGRMVYKENGKWGATDENFNTVIAPEFDTIYPFENTDGGVTVAVKDGKMGLIDRNGNVAADFIYDEIEPFYDNGGIYAYRVMQGESYMAMNGEKYGLLDKYGKVIKQLDEYLPRRYYEEYGLIEISERETLPDETIEIFGMVDLDGKYILPVENRMVGIQNGIILVKNTDGKYGYCDLNGKPITEFKYNMASYFSEGLAFVSSRDGDVWTHEVINEKGETVFDAPDWSSGFYDGIAHIGKGTFIDTEGKTVIENPNWSTVSGMNWWDSYKDGTFIVSDGEKMGVVKYTKFISEWAREYVKKAEEQKIIESDGDYNFTAPITREEFCELVFNLICAVNQSLNTDDREVKFTDTNNDKVYALNRADIIYGKSDTEFAPNDFLTREEAATILVRMISREMPMAATELWFEFDDIKDVSYWASESVQTMCNLGFMNGMGDNKFAPKGTYTAEQAIATLMRIYEATRETYNYETPLGIIRTETDCNSHINFAIQCDATVELIQDEMNFDETHYVIEKPVKALTDQTSHMLIGFDDFAEIFSGEWKLNDGTFEFTYNTSSDVKLEKFEKYDGENQREWPNKTDALDVITFYPDMSTIRVNGEDTEIKSQYGGKVYDGAITMYEGELYIPVQMVAELLGFDIAALQAIY